MFDVNLQNENEVVLSGRFDASQAEKVDSVLNKIQGDCVVNFMDLQYISSAGLGSLLKTYARLKDSGNTIKLINLNKHIHEVFRFSGLDKVFIIE